MMQFNPERLAYSKGEVAKMLGVSLSTIDRMVRDEKLRTIHVGKRRVLIPREEVQRLLDPKRSSN